MKKFLGAVKGLAALLAVFFAVQTYAADDICSQPMSTSEGLIKGLDHQKYSACVWKGIPYAAPPVEDLRLRTPRGPEPREGVFEAYEFGPSCPQEELLTTGGKSAAFSEDCLTLNIFSPQKSGRFPVMVWIHGGAFREGAGTYEMYNGARLAADKDVVVVTVNYRIGALGFLALPELAVEDPNGSTGNYGILDQIQALKWVQQNISGFNGDPDNVTIFGQSAGGMSVCALLASPPAAGLFHRAIPMSGSCGMARDMESGYKQGKQFAKDLGCEGDDMLDCLRRKDPWDLVPESGNLIFTATTGKGHSPHIDGYVLADQPVTCIREGNYNKVPVMVSHTRDEVRLYTLVIPGLSLVPRFAIKKLMRRFLGETTDEVLELYSFSDYKHPSQLVLAVANDGFVSQGYIAAEALSEETTVYLYRFDWDETRLPKKMGAFHGLDIPFVFGCEELESQIARILATKKIFEKARPLSDKVMSYYTNFAKTGDPNGPGLPEWPAYTADTRMRMYFDIPIRVEPLTEKEIERYELFSEYGLGDLLGESE